MSTSYQPIANRPSQTRINPATAQSTSPKVATYLRAREQDTDTNYNTLQQALAGIMTVGTLSERPTAGTVGRMFLATDNSTLYVDIGSGWVSTK